MKLKLIQRKPETADVESFIFEPDQSIRWQAGQYLHYSLPHIASDDRGTERWFTISSAPYEGNIRLTTRFTNPGGSSFKDALRAMKIGDFIEGDSPDGDFIYSPDISQSVMIAGGIGITPYRSILLELDHNSSPINATLLYTNHDADFVFMTELDRLQLKYPDFQVYKYTGDQRIKSDELNGYIKQAGTVFYISGPKKMVDNYQVLLDELAVPSGHIKLDYFPGYGVYNLQP